MIKWCFFFFLHYLDLPKMQQKKLKGKCKASTVEAKSNHSCPFINSEWKIVTGVSVNEIWVVLLPSVTSQRVAFHVCLLVLMHTIWKVAQVDFLSHLFDVYWWAGRRLLCLRCQFWFIEIYITWIHKYNIYLSECVRASCFKIWESMKNLRRLYPDRLCLLTVVVFSG